MKCYTTNEFLDKNPTKTAILKQLNAFYTRQTLQWSVMHAAGSSILADNL